MPNPRNSRKAEIREYLENCHAQSWAIIDELENEDEMVPVYSGAESEWTVRNIIAHLADAERGMLGQMKRAVAGEKTVPDDFDLDRWNRGVARKSSKGTLQDYKDGILDAYQSLLRFLDELDDDILDLNARHSSGDIISMEGYFRRIATHRLEHVLDLRQAMAN